MRHHGEYGVNGIERTSRAPIIAVKIIHERSFEGPEKKRWFLDKGGNLEGSEGVNVGKGRGTTRNYVLEVLGS